MRQANKQEGVTYTQDLKKQQKLPLGEPECCT